MQEDSELADIGEPEDPSSRKMNKNVVTIVNKFTKDSNRSSSSKTGAKDPLLKKASSLLEEGWLVEKRGIWQKIFEKKPLDSSSVISY